MTIRVSSFQILTTRGSPAHSHGAAPSAARLFRANFLCSQTSLIPNERLTLHQGTVPTLYKYYNLGTFIIPILYMRKASRDGNGKRGQVKHRDGGGSK